MQVKMQELVKEKQAIQQQVDAMKTRLEEIDEEIFSLVQDRVKPQGSTTIEQDGIKLTVTIPMRVSWDESKLRGIADMIRAANDDPEQYIQYKLSVPESKYKAWPEQIQNLFMPARTVTPGKRKIEVKNGI